VGDAAAALGMAESGLRRKLRKWGLEPQAEETSSAKD
jgi:hypothetical protein